MADWLENNTGVVIEASGSEEMILISTVSDSREDLDHLLQALVRLDESLESVGTVLIDFGVTQNRPYCHSANYFTSILKISCFMIDPK